ncbi:hypothetical protein M6D81_13850 [Paenibacillus sp. J5C_2022]|uniref:hypothetical protein n=1 Tax=Paenibacillus sp. J5C2022 TaxID=2977129 RepID=UPI0021D07F3C|nr:hypothetical protein [Paenibacillus sp. J5C2022]MCU6709776.1 hypothetical protein [Paenibacillus sp. J5C2022]
MKKVAIGIVIGAVLMFSGQALAEQASMIGKKVGSVAELYLDGKRMSDVIVIDGKSYAPVRELSEGLGRGVYYKPAEGDNNAIITLSRELYQKEVRIEIIKGRIVEVEEKLEYVNDPEYKLRYVYKDGMSDEEYAKLVKEVNAEKAEKIAELEEELTGLQLELEALQSTEREPEVNEVTK